MDTDDSTHYENARYIEFSEEQIRRSIPMNELEAHINSLFESIDPNQSDINGFDVEFNFIYEVEISIAEKTRVQLKPDLEEEGSDYINANYVGGLIPGSERAYIATQGPLQATFADFWRMVWELNTAVIIMLTKEVENGRLKCDKYWPEVDCPLVVGYFRINLIEFTETVELTTRLFELTNFEENESRNITQFQYTAWPDHGLPVSTTAFLDLAHSVDIANNTKGPIVVHCSAGIGRSGTFCTVHSTIEKFKVDLEQHPEIEPSVSLVNTVLYMRDQRPGMVQTKEQYMFCYLAIKEEVERLFHENKLKLQQNKKEREEETKNNNSNGVTKPTSTIQ